MRKIPRNLSTPESREFWSSAEADSAEVKSWPEWKRAGLSVAQIRREPRETPAEVSKKVRL
jgi:hypothetical protein